jgi:hypothetical protein
MSDLSSIFDILRGWPDGSALTWDFVQDSGAASDIEEGSVVAVVAASSPTSVDRHTSALIGPNNDQLDHPWLVIRGKESSESDFTGKLTCLKLRTGVVFKVPTTETHTIGNLVWADTGALTNVDPGSNIPHLGKVIEFNDADNWMVVES